jgi:hypothetical protein
MIMGEMKPRKTGKGKTDNSEIDTYFWTLANLQTSLLLRRSIIPNPTPTIANTLAVTVQIYQQKVYKNSLSLAFGVMVDGSSEEWWERRENGVDIVKA